MPTDSGARAAQEITFDAGVRRLSGLWSPVRSAAAVAVIAHGAGNTMHHPYFLGVVDGLAAEKVAALRFNFSYTEAGRRSPDPRPVLMEAWRGALAEATRRSRGAPIVATGKSLGGRVASMVAAEDGDAFAGSALVFFGYPLHAPGKADRLRSEHLARITVPMLFIQGTADPFGRFDLIQEVVEGLGRLARLRAIEEGDHSHRVRGVRRSDREIGEDLGRVAGAFIREVAAEPAPGRGR